MSLGLTVLRALTVKALTGRTWAGPAVFASSIKSIDEFAAAEPRPFVLVFTDIFDTDKGDVTGRDIIGANVEVTLALEIGCATRVPTEDGQGQTIVLPQTDEGMELTIDMIQRQAIVELQASNAIWPRLWRDFVTEVRGISGRRGASAEQGVRYAARRFELQCGIIADPIPGEPVPADGTWAAVFAAMTADSQLGPLVPLLRAAAEGNDLPDWRRAQAELGLTLAGIRATGLAPIFDTTDEAAPDATEGAGEHKERTEIIKVTPSQATIQEGEAGTPIVLIETP